MAPTRSEGAQQGAGTVHAARRIPTPNPAPHVAVRDGHLLSMAALAPEDARMACAARSGRPT